MNSICYRLFHNSRCFWNAFLSPLISPIQGKPHFPCRAALTFSCPQHAPRWDQSVQPSVVYYEFIHVVGARCCRDALGEGGPVQTTNSDRKTAGFSGTSPGPREFSVSPSDPESSLCVEGLSVPPSLVPTSCLQGGLFSFRLSLVSRHLGYRQI